MFDDITIENVRKAMNTVAPSWASSGDVAGVAKYKDWDSFHNSNSFNSELFEV